MEAKNNIGWETDKPLWQSQIRAHNLKREPTQSEITQSLINRKVAKISKPRVGLSKQTRDTLARLTKKYL